MMKKKDSMKLDENFIALTERRVSLYVKQKGRESGREKLGKCKPEHNYKIKF